LNADLGWFGLIC